MYKNYNLPLFYNLKKAISIHGISLINLIMPDLNKITTDVLFNFRVHVLRDSGYAAAITAVSDLLLPRHTPV